MIRKIKKYKINIRPFAVSRLLKKTSAPENPVELPEEKIEEEIALANKFIAPSSLFGTFSKSQIPANLQTLLENSAKKTISVSLIASTIGNAIEAEIEAAKRSGDVLKSSLLDSIAREALEQSVNFVIKLLNEEAKEENCEVSQPWTVDVSLSKDFLELLESQKADISIGETGPISPLYTKLCVCYWDPVRR